MPTIDFDELISYYAKRGDIEMISVLRQIEEDMQRQEDPDYEYESESESEVSIDTEDSDCSVELDDNGCEPEEVEINPSMNGFCSIA
tara:strand:- start:2322 stop:2582 length:261 start_codon:yes stop_codon:yes gene_type:complete